MSYKEQYLKDLEYVYSKTGDIALWNGKEIYISKVENYDFETIEGDLYSVLAKDVIGIKVGDVFTIDGIIYKCLNLDVPEDFQIKIVISKI